MGLWSAFVSRIPLRLLASGTPVAGQVPTALSATRAEWQTPSASGGPATQLDTTGAAVDVSGAAPPTAGDVLTATDATHATWQAPTAGGGPTDAQVTLDFTTGKEVASVSLADAAVLSTTRIVATLSIVASADKTADEVLADPIACFAAPVAGVGIVVYGYPLSGGQCIGKYLVDVLYQ